MSLLCYVVCCAGTVQDAPLTQLFGLALASCVTGVGVRSISMIAAQVDGPNKLCRQEASGSKAWSLGRDSALMIISVTMVS